MGTMTKNNWSEQSMFGEDYFGFTSKKGLMLFAQGFKRLARLCKAINDNSGQTFKTLVRLQHDHFYHKCCGICLALQNVHLAVVHKI